MVFTTEGFLEVAIENWTEWNLNPLWQLMNLTPHPCAVAVGLPKCNSCHTAIMVMTILRSS